jgi:hypothetical protein
MDGRSCSPQRQTTRAIKQINSPEVFRDTNGKTAGEEQLLTAGQPRIIGARRPKGGKGTIARAGN